MTRNKYDMRLTPTPEEDGEAVCRECRKSFGTDPDPAELERHAEGHEMAVDAYMERRKEAAL